MHCGCIYAVVGTYSQLQVMRRPISKLKELEEEELGKEECSKLAQLTRMHDLNLKTQQKLKKVRDDIMTRMQTIDDFISTYRLKTEYPPASEMVSYIKFERNTPQSFHQQSKVLQQQEAIRQTTEDDSLFIKKLNDEKPKRKKKELNLSELPKDARLIKFNDVALNSHFKLGIDAYRAWLEFNKVKLPKRPFTPHEEQLIIAKHYMYGQNWEKICHYIENRTFQQVYYEFQNRLNPHMVTGRWSHRHSLMLIILLEHFGTRRWAQIAQKMGVKSELQVRERYCNILNPSIGKNTWTVDMEKRLIELAVCYNFSWKDMVKLPVFQNKTDNCIWRRFRKQMIRKPKEEIRQIVTKKDLLQKILKFKDMVEAKRKTPLVPNIPPMKIGAEVKEIMRETFRQAMGFHQDDDHESEENDLLSS